jgi:1-deoxy-D-xylulose-5-phosphate synthase
VAVIGDGALSGGMAFEALNNIGQLKSNLIIILNDNKMSISENVGGMSKYLNKIRVGDRYNEFKGDVEQALLSIPKIGYPIAKTVKRSKDSIKQLLVPGMFFEDMGITYVGPVDGHDVNQLVDTIENAKTKHRPIIIHVVSKKGKGYRIAEKHPEHFHGVNPFDIKTGKALVKKEVATYTDVFSKKLVTLGETHTDLVTVTAAMAEGTGLQAFADKYPERFFDVGIAEEHAVTFAAGMAAAGLHPVVAVYSSFLQRAYDQILHDVCLSNLHVILAVDRSGLVGADGDTHQGIFDNSFLSSIPNMTVMAPKNRYEMSRMLEFAVDYDGPIAIKYPRGSAYYELKEYQTPIVYGKSELIYKGRKVALICVGKMMEQGLEAYRRLLLDNIEITLVNARFVTPLDEELLCALGKEHDAIVTVEDNVYSGGYGQAVAAYLRTSNVKCKVRVLAIDNRFVEQGTVAQLQHMLGIDADAIVSAVREFTHGKKAKKTK